MTSTIHLDELDRVLMGTTVKSTPSGPAGGEWDYLLALPRRTRRRLIGAGYLTTYGEQPDVAAELIIAHVAGVENIDDAMAWYVRTALRALAERRRLAHHRRHQRHAALNGRRSYYEHRTALAVAAGHRSLWHYRKSKGWT